MNKEKQSEIMNRNIQNQDLLEFRPRSSLQTYPALPTSESSMRFSFSDVRHLPTSTNSTPRGVLDLNQTNTFEAVPRNSFLKIRKSLRFDTSMTEVLRKQFNKKSQRGRMSQQQFRECMGLLGLETTSFLSDRIFSVVDANLDGFIQCNEFLHVMDILVNGSK